MKQRHKAHNYASVDSILSNFAGRPVKYFLIVASVISVLFPVYWLVISAFKLEQDYLADPPILFPPGTMCCSTSPTPWSWLFAPPSSPL